MKASLNPEQAISNSAKILERFNQEMLQRDAKTLLRYYFELIKEVESGGLRRLEAVYMISMTGLYQVVCYNVDLETTVMLADELLMPKLPSTWTIEDDRWYKFVKIVTHQYILYDTS